MCEEKAIVYRVITTQHLHEDAGRWWSDPCSQSRLCSFAAMKLIFLNIFCYKLHTYTDLQQQNVSWVI